MADDNPHHYSLSVPPPGFERFTLYLPEVDLSLYVLHPDATLSADETVVTVSSDTLTSDSSALLQFLKYQAQLPPRPQIRIKGTHTSDGESQVDFDIRLDLHRYLMTRAVQQPPNAAGQDPANDAGQKPANDDRAVEKDELTVPGREENRTVSSEADNALKYCIDLFCQSDQEKKALTFERTVTNWNTTLLEARIRTLLVNLKYKGNLEITFPVTHSKIVVVAPPAPADFVLFARTGKSWPYANRIDEQTADQGNSNGNARVCTTQSENDWWQIWNGAIASAVLDKRVGWVETKDVILSALNGRYVDIPGPAEEWGVNS